MIAYQFISRGFNGHFLSDTAHECTMAREMLSGIAYKELGPAADLRSAHTTCVVVEVTGTGAKRPTEDPPPHVGRLISRTNHQLLAVEISTTM